MQNPTSDNTPIDETPLDTDADDIYKLAEMQKRWEDSLSFWEPTFRRGRNNMELIYGDGGWDDDLRAKRVAAGLTCLDMNQLIQHKRIVTGDFRKQDISINVGRTDSDGNSDDADTFEGIARGIEQASRANKMYRRAFDLALTANIGWLTLHTEYEQDSYDQVLRIGAPEDFDGTLVDPAENPRYGFFMRQMSRAAFEKKWPESSHAVPPNYEHLADNIVFVIEYYYTVPAKKTITLLDDGSIYNQEDVDDWVQSSGREIVDQRVIDDSKTFMRLATWDEFLEDEQETVFNGIPIFPVTGQRVKLGGKVHYEGMFDHAQDPQRQYNWNRTIAAEASSMVARYAWLASDGAVEGYESLYTSYMNNPIALLKYRDGYPEPRLSQPAMPDIASMQQVSVDRQDIMAALGRYEATLGDNGTEKSGKAIQERKQTGDAGTMDLRDNMGEAIEAMLRMLINAIPRVYDTKRMVRMVGKDGKVTNTEINNQVMGEDGHPKIINDISVGRYDITVDIGPGYQTLKEEMADKVRMLTEGDPELNRRVVDVIASGINSPNADLLQQRLEGVIPMDALSVEELEERAKKDQEKQQLMEQMGQQNPQIQQMEQQMQEMDQLIQELQAKDAEGQAKQAQAQANIQISELKVQREELNLQVAKINAESEGMVAEVNAGATRDKLESEREARGVNESKIKDDAARDAVKQLVMDEISEGEAPQDIE